MSDAAIVSILCPDRTGLIAAIASYYLTRPLVEAYQARRRARLLARARERLARQAAEAYKADRSGSPGQ